MPAKSFQSSFLSCLLMLGMACATTACLPKARLVTSEEAHIQAVQTSGNIDSALAMERDILSVVTHPGRLVDSTQLSVSAISSHDSLYGEGLELLDDDLELLDGELAEALPAGLMELERGTVQLHPATASGSAGVWDFGIPAPGTTEEKALIALNTQEALCGPGETVCLTSPFGVRRSGNHVHKGVDIRAPFGSPIMAFRSGVVLRAQYHKTYGYLVEIQQDDGLIARYAHMSHMLTTKGSRVESGLMIGRVGSTGRSTGPHLHFELLRNDRQTNPMVYLSTLDYVVTKATDEDAAAARVALRNGGRTPTSKKAKASASTKAASSKTATKSSAKTTAATVNRSASTHTIRNGDTLWDIAKAYGTTVGAIQAVNSASALKTLRPGKTIKLPARATSKKTAQK